MKSYQDNTNINIFINYNYNNFMLVVFLFILFECMFNFTSSIYPENNLSPHLPPIAIGTFVLAIGPIKVKLH